MLKRHVFRHVSWSHTCLVCLKRTLCFLNGQNASSIRRLSNNRSVMPLDVLGCTRATMKVSVCFILGREVWVNIEPPSWLGLWTVTVHMNPEFPVSASHKLALITSLPFVHTARRYY